MCKRLLTICTHMQYMYITNRLHITFTHFGVSSGGVEPRCSVHAIGEFLLINKASRVPAAHFLFNSQQFASGAGPDVPWARRSGRLHVHIKQGTRKAHVLAQTYYWRRAAAIAAATRTPAAECRIAIAWLASAAADSLLPRHRQQHHVRRYC